MYNYTMQKRAKGENKPTDPDLWQKVQELTAGEKSYIIVDGEKIEGPNDGEGYTNHPSAYSNGWAVQVYNDLGGDWKKAASDTILNVSIKIAGVKTSDLGEWFESENWGAYNTKGERVGPCGISDHRPEETKEGKDPLKCLPESKAKNMTKEERASAARRKKDKERKSPNTGKPVHSPTKK